MCASAHPTLLHDVIYFLLVNYGFLKSRKNNLALNIPPSISCSNYYTHHWLKRRALYHTFTTNPTPQTQSLPFNMASNTRVLNMLHPSWLASWQHRLKNNLPWTTRPALMKTNHVVDDQLHEPNATLHHVSGLSFEGNNLLSVRFLWTKSFVIKWTQKQENSRCRQSFHFFKSSKRCRGKSKEKNSLCIMWTSCFLYVQLIKGGRLRKEPPLSLIHMTCSPKTSIPLPVPVPMALTVMSWGNDEGHS